MNLRKKMVEEQNPLPKQRKGYFTPAIYHSPTKTRMPTAMGPFRIKHSLIQMLLSFHGVEYENPFKHGDGFLEICSIFFLNDISDDALGFHLFSFSLKDKAKAWVDTKTNIINQDQMQKELLKSFLY